MLQALINTAVVVSTVALLTVMSVRANRRFASQPRLPMQWGMDGSVNWTAPRKIALAFTPVMAAICLSPVAAAAPFLKAKTGQEGLATPGVALCAVAFLAVHALHLWLIQREQKRQK